MARTDRQRPRAGSRRAEARLAHGANAARRQAGRPRVWRRRRHQRRGARSAPRTARDRATPVAAHLPPHEAVTDSRNSPFVWRPLGQPATCSGMTTVRAGGTRLVWLSTSCLLATAPIAAQAKSPDAVLQAI